MSANKKKNFGIKKLKSKKNTKSAVQKKARKINVNNKCTVAIGNRDVRAKKTNRKIYTPEALKNAIQAYTVSKSLSIRTVARTYGIPLATLARKVNNPTTQDKKSGPKTVLNSDEEESIVKWILNRAAMGFPVIKDDLLSAVENYVSSSKKDNPFIDNRPGRHWYEGFMRRHPSVTIRTPQHLSHRRAEVTRENLQEWFSEQKEYLSSKNLLNIPSSQVFNCDETNVALCPKSSKILTKKGSLTAYKITDDAKEGITVLFMYSAAGTRAPPMIMFPYKENLH